MSNTPKNLALIGRHAWTVVLGALFALGCFFAAPSQANAQNFDLNAAFGWQGMILDDVDDGHGPMLNVSFGYRFHPNFGVYVEQDLGGLVWRHWDVHPHHKHFRIFNGATLVGVRGFLTFGSFELWGKVGIGAIYTADSDGDAWDQAWFAFRLGIGGTYMITKIIGVGLDFSYTLGAADTHAHVDDVVNFVSLKAHVSFRF